MKKMTEENLKNAFAGESQANVKYLIFANKAEKEGFPNVAKILRAVAYSEQLHATNHYDQLGNIQETSKNLQIAIDGETFEIEEMYPAYKAVAELQLEKGAQRTLYWAIEAEKIHLGLHRKAKQAVDSGKDVEIGDIFVCGLCGYTMEAPVPDKCPICGWPKEKFKKFTL
jgi:rubrerythrin